MLPQVEKSSFQWISFLKSLCSGEEGGTSPTTAEGVGSPALGCRGLRRDAQGALSYCYPGGALAVDDEHQSPALDTAVISSLVQAHKRCWTASIGVPSGRQSPSTPSTLEPETPPLPTLEEHCSSPRADASPAAALSSPFVGVKSAAGVPGAKRAGLSISLPSLSRKASGSSSRKSLVKQLESLVLCGVPPMFRAAVWFELSGAAVRQVSPQCSNFDATLSKAFFTVIHRDLRILWQHIHAFVFIACACMCDVLGVVLLGESRAVSN